MAMQFLDKHDLLCLEISSKWELSRLCQAVGATHCLGSVLESPCQMKRDLSNWSKTTRNGWSNCHGLHKIKLATIVLRASTRTLLANLERAVDDGVQATATITNRKKKEGTKSIINLAAAAAANRRTNERINQPYHSFIHQPMIYQPSSIMVAAGDSGCAGKTVWMYFA